jgi:hypothetical protein
VTDQVSGLPGKLGLGGCGEPESGPLCERLSDVRVGLARRRSPDVGGPAVIDEFEVEDAT